LSEEHNPDLDKLDSEKEHEEPGNKPLDWKSDAPLFLEYSPADRVANDQDEKDETVE
jgi:hypothetical protein